MNRSQIMARVGSRDTKPELQVRRLLTDMGQRYRLHRADIPGRPDIAFIGQRKAIFVHGCFWHGHDCRRGARAPKNNAEYWRAKINRTRLRDEKNRRELSMLGWECLIIWECELRDMERVCDSLKTFLAGEVAKTRTKRSMDRVPQARAGPSLHPVRPDCGGDP